MIGPPAGSLGCRNVDNSNNSWGTFFEGAIVAGWPSDDTEQAIMQNLKAVGY